MEFVIINCLEERLKGFKFRVEIKSLQNINNINKYLHSEPTLEIPMTWVSDLY